MTQFIAHTPPRAPISRVEFISLFSLVTALTAFSIDAILPGLTRMAGDLGVLDIRTTQLVVTMFVLGMGVGEMGFGPLADAIGRKKTIMIGLVIFAIGSVISMFATSIEGVIAGRIVQGVGAAGPKIASRAVIRDMFRGSEMARIMSLIMLLFILVPMIAPMLGQAVMLTWSWRAVFGLFLIMAVVIALWLGLRQPETLSAATHVPLSLNRIFRNSRRILRHRRVVVLSIAGGGVFATILTYVSTAQALFADLYGEVDRFPLFFAFLALSLGAASLTNARIVMALGMERVNRAAFMALLVLGSTMVLVVLYFGGVPPLPLFLAMCFGNFFALALTFSNLNAMAMDYLGAVAGLGAALVSFVSTVIAVALSYGIGRFYDATATPLACAFVIAGGLGLAMLRVMHTGADDPVVPV